MDHFDTGQPAFPSHCLACRRLCRQHRFEKRQRNGRTQPTKNGTPGDVFLGDEHQLAFLSDEGLVTARIWNGVLFTISRMKEVNRLMFLAALRSTLRTVGMSR